MADVSSSFLQIFSAPSLIHKPLPSQRNARPLSINCGVTPDPWTLSDGNDITKPKPRSKNPKNTLSDDNARRIINAKARYLSALRKNQGSHVKTPLWIKRTPEQMVQYLKDDRNGHVYGKHVVAAIQTVRRLAGKTEGSYDMREVMGPFVLKLTFREMCTVLKEQRGWRQARDFFAWMKLQLCYHPSVIVYTIMLRIYGQVGRIKLAEQTFLEMLEAGCEPDEVACGTMLCVYARWGRHKAMLSFYSAMQERGIILSLAVFNFMISSLHKKSLHQRVLEIWTQMLAKGAIPNHFTYTIVISSLVKEGLYEEAFKTFDNMKNLGFVPEEVTYGLLMSIYCKNGNQEMALRLYDDLKHQGIVPSSFTCASLLTLYYRNADYKSAFSLFTEMECNKIAADEVIYGLLIKMYGKLGLLEDAEKTFEEMKKLGLLSDEKTYVTMSLVYLHSGNVEKALNILEVLRPSFSQFACAVLLRCYVMKEDLRSAEITFQILIKMGLPDVSACNDLLSLYIRLSLTKKAKGFIVHVRKFGVEFDEVLYKTALMLYCKKGMLRDAEQLIEEMIKNKLFVDSKFVQTISLAVHGTSRRPEIDGFESAFEPDISAVELLINLYLSNANDDKAQEVLESLVKMSNGLSMASQLISKFIREGAEGKAVNLYGQLIKVGCQPDDSDSASMISFYGKQQKLKEAEEVFSAVAVSPKAGKPLCTAMIDAYIRCSKPDEAYSLYKRVTEQGHDVGAVATSILVNALIKYSKHEYAKNVIRSSFERRAELDTAAYNTFIKAMLVAGKLRLAAWIFERMLSSEVAPSIQTYNTMISVYGRGKNLDKAVEMFNMARDSGPLDEKAYANMINYYGKAGKIHEALLLFQRMQEEGIKAGKVNYGIMFNILASAGLHQEAEKLLEAMFKDGCSPDSANYLALVRAYALSSKFSEAEETIISMQREGISPSCAHYNSLISAFARAGLVQESKRVYKKLFAAGLSPDRACVHSMLRGYLYYGHVGDGISLYETMCMSVRPDRFIMSVAIHFYKAAGMEVKAEGVLNSMSSMGLSFMDDLQVGSMLGPPQSGKVLCNSA